MNHRKLNASNWSEDSYLTAGMVVKYENGYYESINGFNGLPPNESPNFKYLGEVEKFGSFMGIEEFVIGGKIRGEKIDALGLTELIQVTENTLTDFLANNANYVFEKNDFIAIPDNNGDYSLYIYTGADKSLEMSYIATGLSSINIGMVQGLQEALDSKLNKADFKTEFLTTPSTLTQAEKEAFGTAWNDQYSNGALNVYSITPPIINRDNTVKYIVLQGLNLNVNPTTTSVKFIPTVNALGVGEIDCLGFQTQADGNSMIVTIIGDSLADMTDYNIVIRTISPTTQTHRTTSIITVTSMINSFDLSTITWQKKIYNDLVNDGVFGIAGAGQYQSNEAVKPYANESTVVAALKSSKIVEANQDFYLNFDATASYPFLPAGSGNSFHSIGVMSNSSMIDLLDFNLGSVKFLGSPNNNYSKIVQVDNSTLIQSAQLVQAINYTIIRRGSIVYFLLLMNGITYTYSKSISTEALSFAIFNSNMNCGASISFNITELLIF
jgi:hypothetical protein